MELLRKIIVNIILCFTFTADILLVFSANVIIPLCIILVLLIAIVWYPINNLNKYLDIYK